MLRFINYLSLILFFQMAIAKPYPYLKQGAAVALTTTSYKLENSSVPHILELEFYATKIGLMQLSYSTSGSATIVETTASELQWNKTKPKLTIPITVRTEQNTKSYLNIFVTFTDDYGTVTSRALSAILNTGQVPVSKTIGNAPSVISMRAVETITTHE